MFIRRRVGEDTRGDTIVEVLIAVAVVSLVIVSAYAIVNRSLMGIQAAQEQSYAQKLVEQQVEMLRAADVSPSPLGGCYNPGTAAYQPALSSCDHFVSGGATYTIVITQDASGVYRVQTTWDALGGQQARVTAYYVGIES